MKRRSVMRVRLHNSIKNLTHSKKVQLEDSENALDFVNKKEGVIAINNQIPLKTYAFKMRVSKLPAYNATYVSGKIVMSKDETYIPKGHFSNSQYKKVMELVIRTIPLENVSATK